VLDVPPLILTDTFQRERRSGLSANLRPWPSLLGVTFDVRAAISWNESTGFYSRVNEQRAFPLTVDRDFNLKKAFNLIIERLFWQRFRIKYPFGWFRALRQALAARWLRRITCDWEIRGIPRILYGTRHWLLGNGPARFALQRVDLVLDPDDYFQCMMFYGRYGPETLEVMNRFVRPGDTVLDIGAQVGYFSTQLARMVTDTGRVYCFEPDPTALERLNASVGANQMDWVTVVPLALSSREGSMDFYLSEHLGWSTGVSSSHLTDLHRTQVRTVPLDTLVERGQIPREVRLAKIDVEGFELEVLRGMQGMLGTSPPILIVEINRAMQEAQEASGSEIQRLLREFGYRLYLIAKTNHWGRMRVRIKELRDDFPQACDVLAIPNDLPIPDFAGH
jgi:FkbM family methyltransferase